jgi:hypothetical protein
MNAGRELEMESVRKVFLSTFAGLARRKASPAARADVLDRVRESLLQLLSSASIDADPVGRTRQRAIIAAGFEAAIREAERQGILAPASTGSKAGLNSSCLV